MGRRIVTILVVLLAISSIPLGIYSVVLRQAAARAAEEDNAALAMVEGVDKGIPISETCGLAYFDHYGDSIEDVLVGGCRGAFRRVGRNSWGVSQMSSFIPVIDATNFRPDSGESYLRQMGRDNKWSTDATFLDALTHAEQIALTLAKEAASQDREWTILFCSPMVRGAMVVLGHPYGITTLVLAREDGDAERYRLYQSFATLTGVYHPEFFRPYVTTDRRPLFKAPPTSE